MGEGASGALVWRLIGSFVRRMMILFARRMISFEMLPGNGADATTFIHLGHRQTQLHGRCGPSMVWSTAWRFGVAWGKSLAIESVVLSR